MENEMKRCSTPLVGQITDPPLLPWSEIRGNGKTSRIKRVNSLPTRLPIIKVTKSKQKGRNNRHTKTNEVDELSSNWDQQTIFENEVDRPDYEVDPNSSRFYQQPDKCAFNSTEIRTPKLRHNCLHSFNVNDENLRCTNYSPLSPKPLFYSPSEKRYDQYEKSHLDTREDQTLQVRSDHFISSPESEIKTTQFRTYCGPGIQKPKLSPSQISFSPIWANKIAPKYNSPSDIPSRDVTLNATRTSPERTGWATELMSHSAIDLWEKFVNNSGPSKGQKFIKRTIIEQRDIKYSHPQVNCEKSKKSKSPNRKKAVLDSQKIIEGWIASPRQIHRLMIPLWNDLSPNSTARNDNSQKVNTPNPATSSAINKTKLRDKLETPVETEIEGGSSLDVTSCKIKSKPRVVSVKKVKIPIKFTKLSLHT